MKQWLIIPGYILLALLISCDRSSKDIELDTTAKPIPYPILSEFPTSGELIDTSRQLESIYFPLFVSDRDTVIFSTLQPFEPCCRYLDTVEYSNSNQLEIFVDQKQPVASKYKERKPPSFYLIYLDENGKKIPQEPYKPPYDSVMKLPVFIRNITDSSQIIQHHDGRMMMVQEALNKEGKWKAIEYFEFSGCGNSIGIHLLLPGEYMMFGVNQYKGNFKTKFRVRLQTNGTILFSNEYDGCMNESQFNEVEPSGGFGWNRYLTEEY